MERKLAAILAADVVGYSRLMEQDEAGTLAALKSHREGLIDPTIAERHGRIVKLMGDGALVEFASVVDAVASAVAIQEGMAGRNAEVPEARRIALRIGVHLGDVMVEADDLYGEGVNLASRLEGLAEPGGVCISQQAYDQIENKLDVEFAYLGEFRVKNIEKPVRTYAAVLGDKAPAAPRPWKAGLVTKGQLFAAVVIAVAVAAGGITSWLKPWTPDVEPVSVERMAFPLPEKPSIAVLPFDNLSGDPEQEYFADGLTEEIITGLSKIPNLFVIARGSTYTYKDKSVKVRQVAEEMGVRHVLEGSVRKAGERLRITAQLIDATTGNHIWAERYDREAKDIFALQDDITLNIARALQVELTEGEQERVRFGRGTENLEAWAHAVRGLGLARRFTKEDNARAQQMFERAIELDPEYAAAWSFLGWTYLHEARWGWAESRAESLKRAVDLGENALALDDALPITYALLGSISLMKREYDQAIAYNEKAVALEPNGADRTAALGWTLTYVGKPTEAAVLLEKAMRLSPYYPPWYLSTLGRAYRLAGRYDEAIAALKRAEDRNPKNLHTHVVLAVIYSELGRQEDARAKAADILNINPKFTIRDFAKAIPYKDPAELKRIVEALLSAGLPEKPPLLLPDKPSIAVLPFDNLSADPEQEYFADGVTNDIITDLSKFKNLFVIASNSTFSYKGKRVKVQQVARELGVRYVLEGSIQRAGDRVRINAQLIDAATGHHMWAERYERELKDIFALQDEIVQTIVATVTGRLTQAEEVRAKRKSTDSLEAYEYVLRAQQARLSFTKEGNAEALRLNQRAVELDPEYARAHAGLAGVHLFDAILGWSESPAESINRSFEFAKRAVTLDDSDYLGHWYLGRALIAKKEFDQGLAEYEKAMALNPNAANLMAHKGLALTWVGRPEEAVGWIKKAARLNPYYPDWYPGVLGFAYYMASQYEEAIAPLMEAVNRNPKALWMRTHLAASYAQLGRDEEAREAAAGILEINPEFSINRWRRGFGLSFKNPADVEHHLDGLRKAGLPEG